MFLQSRRCFALVQSTLAAELAKAEELRQRLDAVKGESKRKVTPQDFANATASHKKYRNAWRDRKTKVSSNRQ